LIVWREICLSKEAKIMNITEFLETKPLYSKEKIQPFELRELIQPEILNLECPHCKRHQPFHSGWVSPMVQPGRKPPVESGIHDLEYTCHGCNLEQFIFYVDVSKSAGIILKIGQYPAWNISIPKDLEKELGDDSILLKRAKTCTSQGYGLGACAYLRRLIENQINPTPKIFYPMPPD
jgi:hypothetical protein